MASFYKTKVVVTQQRANELQLHTVQHGYDEVACGIWKAERRLRITSQYRWDPVYASPRYTPNFLAMRQQAGA